MGVEVGEVKFAGDAEDHGADGGEQTVSARLALGGLEQAVQGSEEAVGLPRLRPGDDAPACECG